MSINMQPTIESEKVILYPLQEQDFEELYQLLPTQKSGNSIQTKRVGNETYSRLFLREP